MTKREAAKQLVKIWAEAIRLGFYDDQEGTAAEVVALAIAALLKEGDNEREAISKMETTCSLHERRMER